MAYDFQPGALEAMEQALKVLGFTSGKILETRDELVHRAQALATRRGLDLGDALGSYTVAVRLSAQTEAREIQIIKQRTGPPPRESIVFEEGGWSFDERDVRLVLDEAAKVFAE